MEREDLTRILRGAGFTPREIRRIHRAAQYNWHQLKPEVARAARPARRLLVLDGEEGDLTRRLLREVLRPSQSLTALDGRVLGLRRLAEELPGRLAVWEAGIPQWPALAGQYDLAVSCQALHGLTQGQRAPEEALADLTRSIPPRGALLLIDKVLDGVTIESGDILQERLHVDLGALRGHRVRGPQRLADYRALVTGTGLVVARSAIIGQDPGPAAGRVRAAVLAARRAELIGSCPAEKRAEAARLIDGAIARIRQAPPWPLPLAVVVARRRSR